MRTIEADAVYAQWIIEPLEVPAERSKLYVIYDVHLDQFKIVAPYWAALVAAAQSMPGATPSAVLVAEL
jgi:hypothetical protein